MPLFVYWLDSPCTPKDTLVLPSEESIAWINASDFDPYSLQKNNQDHSTDDSVVAAKPDFHHLLLLAQLSQIPLEQRHLPWQPMVSDYEIIPQLFAAAASSSSTTSATLMEQHEIPTKRRSSSPVIVHSKMPTVLQRIGVYWELDNAWYPGTVSKIQNEDFYLIDYDDGESEWLPLAEHRFRFIDDDENKDEEVGMENPGEENNNDDNDTDWEWNEQCMESTKSPKNTTSKKKFVAHTSKHKTPKKQMHKKKSKKKHSYTPVGSSKHKNQIPPDRFTADGCLLPKYTPERDGKGFYKKPKGRIPLGYKWNRRKGIWVPWNPRDIIEESPLATDIATSPTTGVQHQSNEVVENCIWNDTPLTMQPSPEPEGGAHTKQSNHSQLRMHQSTLHRQCPTIHNSESNTNNNNDNNNNPTHGENRVMTQPDQHTIRTVPSLALTQTNVTKVIQTKASAKNHSATQPRLEPTVLPLAVTSFESAQIQPMKVSSAVCQVIQTETKETAKNRCTTLVPPTVTSSDQMRPDEIPSDMNQVMPTQDAAIASSSSTDKRMQIQVSVGKCLMDSLESLLPISSQSSSDHVEKCRRLLENLCQLDLPYSSLKLDLVKPIRQLGQHSVLGDISKSLIDKWQYFYIRDDLMGDWKRALQQGNSKRAMGKAGLLRSYLDNSKNRSHPQESLQQMQVLMVKQGVRQVIDNTWELLESESKTCDALESLEILLNGDEACDGFV
jgi:hypothetical protein